MAHPVPVLSRGGRRGGGVGCSPFCIRKIPKDSCVLAKRGNGGDTKIYLAMFSIDFFCIP